MRSVCAVGERVGVRKGDRGDARLDLGSEAVCGRASWVAGQSGPELEARGE